MFKVEERARLLEEETKRLEADKADLKKFLATKKKLELTDLKHDIALFRDSNHLASMDNYLDKYVPLVIQRQIDETLFSCFSSKERRRLEQYAIGKYVLLYQGLLVEHGKGDTAIKMRILHESARLEIEKEEKRKKKHLAITEATITVAKPGEGISEIGTIERSKDYEKMNYLNAASKKRGSGVEVAPGDPYASLAPVLGTQTP